MCIISILPKGTEKYSDTVINFITNGFKNNEDGSGYMYKKAGTNKIVVNKGFYVLEELLASIKEQNLTIDDELVIHHRVGNIGPKTPENCHPFVCVNNDAIFEKLSLSTSKPCLVHNGTFTDLYDYRKLNNDNSDTHTFAKLIMSNNGLQQLLQTDQELFKHTMLSYLNTSKVCFLLPNQDLVKFGNFIEDEGYFHSNEGYKDGWYRDSGGRIVKKQVPQSHKVNHTNQAGGHLSLDGLVGSLDYKSYLTSLLMRAAVTLDGSIITINEFNYNDFIYGYKDDKHYNYQYVFNMCKYEDAIFQALTVKEDTGDKFTIYMSNKDIHKDLDFMVRGKLNDDYRGYIILMRDVVPNRKRLKKIYNMLKNSRLKPLDFKLHMKNPNGKFSRKSLIEFYNYHKDDFLTDPSELDLKSIYGTLEEQTTIFEYNKPQESQFPILFRE